MLFSSFQSVHKYFIMEINKFQKFITQTEENAVQNLLKFQSMKIIKVNGKSIKVDYEWKIGTKNARKTLK